MIMFYQPKGVIRMASVISSRAWRIAGAEPMLVGFVIVVSFAEICEQTARLQPLCFSSEEGPGAHTMWSKPALPELSVHRNY